MPANNITYTIVLEIFPFDSQCIYSGSRKRLR